MNSGTLKCALIWRFRRHEETIYSFCLEFMLILHRGMFLGLY